MLTEQFLVKNLGALGHVNYIAFELGNFTLQLFDAMVSGIQGQGLLSDLFLKLGLL